MPRNESFQPLEPTKFSREDTARALIDMYQGIATNLSALQMNTTNYSRDTGNSSTTSFDSNPSHFSLNTSDDIDDQSFTSFRDTPDAFSEYFEGDCEPFDLGSLDEPKYEFDELDTTPEENEESSIELAATFSSFTCFVADFEKLHRYTGGKDIANIHHATQTFFQETKEQLLQLKASKAPLEDNAQITQSILDTYSSYIRYLLQTDQKKAAKQMLKEMHTFSIAEHYNHLNSLLNESISEALQADHIQIAEEWIQTYLPKNIDATEFDFIYEYIEALQRTNEPDLIRIYEHYLAGTSPLKPNWLSHVSNQVFVRDQLIIARTKVFIREADIDYALITLSDLADPSETMQCIPSLIQLAVNLGYSDTSINDLGNSLLQRAMKISQNHSLQERFTHDSPLGNIDYKPRKFNLHPLDILDLRVKVASIPGIPYELFLQSVEGNEELNLPRLCDALSDAFDNYQTSTEDTSYEISKIRQLWNTTMKTMARKRYNYLFLEYYTQYQTYLDSSESNKTQISSLEHEDIRQDIHTAYIIANAYTAPETLLRWYQERLSTSEDIYLYGRLPATILAQQNIDTFENSLDILLDTDVFENEPIHPTGHLDPETTDGEVLLTLSHTVDPDTDAPSEIHLFCLDVARLAITYQRPDILKKILNKNILSPTEIAHVFSLMRQHYLEDKPLILSIEKEPWQD